MTENQYLDGTFTRTTTSFSHCLLFLHVYLAKTCMYIFCSTVWTKDIHAYYVWLKVAFLPYYETLLLILTIFDQLHFSSLVKDVPCIQSRLQPHIIEYCIFLFLLLFVMKNTVTALECSITQHEKRSLPWQLHKTNVILGFRIW